MKTATKKEGHPDPESRRTTRTERRILIASGVAVVWQLGFVPLHLGRPDLHPILYLVMEGIVPLLHDPWDGMAVFMLTLGHSSRRER